MTVNPTGKVERTQRSYSTEFPKTFAHDAYDKMSQRIRQFEEDCRQWRERVFNKSKLGKPSSLMLAEQPRLVLDSPDFPEFPSDWQYSSSRHGSVGPVQPIGAPAPYKTYIEQDINGKTWLKIQVNVGDFAPDDLRVRTEGSTLIISGEREVLGENSSRREQFNKEITIPDFADHRDVRSHLTPDGILMIESPVIDNRLTPGSLRGFMSYPCTSQSRSRTETHSGYSSSMSSVATNQPAAGAYSASADSRQVRQTLSPTAATTSTRQISSQALPIHSPSSNVVRDTFSRRDNLLSYRFNLAGFNADNVKIEIRDRTVIIHAKLEQSDEAGKTYREFRKELRLPEHADANSLRNSLSPDGMLTVEVPLKASYQSGEQLRTTTTGAPNDRYVSPTRSSVDVVRERERVPISERNDLRLTYDLSAYRRDNIQIKVTGNVLSIFAPRVEGRSDHDFEQRYNLPNWADGNNAKARVGDDGMLTIEIPRKF